jgi:hypothetical protein
MNINTNKKIALFDILTTRCIEILQLTFDKDRNVISNGEIMEWCDAEAISLSNPIPYDNDKIDAILFFGDGTIEFHLEKECDAINWYYFPTDFIKLVLEEINNKNYEK